MACVLVLLSGHREFISRHGFSNDTMAQALGFGAWIDPQECDFDPKAVRAALRKRHQAGEREPRHAEKPACLASNVACLSQLVGLSEADCRILEFAVLINNDRAHFVSYPSQKIRHKRAGGMTANATETENMHGQCST